jgi:glutaredoxin-related protein
MSESVEQCEVCGCDDTEKLKRVYDKINVKVKQSKQTTAGERVKDFIKDSKEILDQQKAEARVEHD